MLGDDPLLPDEPGRVEKIIYRAEEPLMIHEIIGRMRGKMSEFRTKQELDRLMDEGVVEEGPPVTADGILGLVERESTYQLVGPEHRENDKKREQTDD